MADELLTVAEAAKRLDVSIPRLRRWLARPENASHSFPRERQTRTGIRTAVVIHVSILSKIESEIEQKRERKRLKPSLPEENESITCVAALLQEKDLRITELTAALEHEREHNRKPFWFRWFRVS